MIKTSRTNVFTAFTSLETPVFFTPSHYSLTCVLLTVCLLPAYALLVGAFGWKILALLGLSIAAGFLTEYLGIRVTRHHTGYFGYPVWLLFPLITPPGLELWMSVLCLVLAVIISVILFGGFGYQLFHPVVTAQVFVLINFQVAAASGFLRPFIRPDFGFSVWTSLAGTEETTLKFLQGGGEMGLLRLLWGPNTGFAGDAFPLALLIGGAVFLLLGGVNRKTPLAFLAGLFVFSTLGNLAAPAHFLSFLPSLLGGSAVLYAFFIFSDRWTSAKSGGGRIAAGVLLSLFTVLMRALSSNIEGIVFAALLVTAVTPLLDEFVFSLTGKKRKGGNA